VKILVKIVVSIFMLFLATPTIVSIIDKDVDTSYFFNMSEEEENHCAFNEIKSIPTAFSIPMLIDFEGFQKAKFSIFAERKVNAVKINILLQPPELI
jgi:hypothetical protein